MITIILEYPDNWNSLHQCLLMLFDSPLNHAGMLRVYIRMDQNDPKKMIEMHREIRIPRTFKRFHQLFANFLRGDQMPLVDTKDGQARLMTCINKSFNDKKNQLQGNKFRIINLAPKVRTPKWFSELIEEEKVNHDADDSLNVSQNDDKLPSNQQEQQQNRQKQKQQNQQQKQKQNQHSQHREVILFVDLHSDVNYNILGETRETEYEIKTIELTKDYHLSDDCDCCSLTRYPISPALICVKLTSAFEGALKIL